MVDRGLEFLTGLGAPGGGDPGMDQETGRVPAGIGDGRDQALAGQRRQRPGRFGGVAGPGEPLPQVGPVPLDHRRDPVVFFQAAQQPEHHPRSLR